MAYKNLVSQNCAGFTEEAFQRMRDFICKRNGTYDYSVTGIGWTLHDSYYATDEDNCAIGDWFVAKSVGESGDEDLYFKIKWHEADHLNIQGALYWNNSTHAGVKKFPALDTADILMCDDDLAFPIWIYGDLDQVVIATKSASLYYAAVFGCSVDFPYDGTVATCSSSLSSGSDISITVDSVPSEWAVDRYLYIRDDAEIDKIKIKTLVGNTITADLAHSFAAGNKLCGDLLYYVPVSNQMNASVTVLIYHTGDEGYTLSKITSAICTNSNPDEMNQEPILESISLGYISYGYHGKIKNLGRIASAIPGVSSEDVFIDLSGTDWRVFNCHNNFWVGFKEV